jgi:hypothetical protein
VKAKGAGLEFLQLVRLAGGQLSGFDEFLQFGIHASRIGYEEGIASRTEIECVVLRRVGCTSLL